MRASIASQAIAVRSPRPLRRTTVTVFRPSLKACRRIAIETRIPVSVLTSKAEPIARPSMKLWTLMPPAPM